MRHRPPRHFNATWYCPHCDEPIEVDIYSGVPQTRDSPAEGPDADITSQSCKCEITEEDLEEMLTSYSEREADDDDDR